MDQIGCAADGMWALGSRRSDALVIAIRQSTVLPLSLARYLRNLAYMLYQPSIVQAYEQRSAPSRADGRSRPPIGCQSQYCTVNLDRATGCCLGSATLVHADIQQDPYTSAANSTPLRLNDRPAQ